MGKREQVFCSKKGGIIATLLSYLLVRYDYTFALIALINTDVSIRPKPCS